MVYTNRTIITDLNGLLTALSTIGKGAISFSFSCVYIYAVDLFPTPVRNNAVGTSSVFARIGGMAAPYMGPPMVSTHQVQKYVEGPIYGLYTGKNSPIIDGNQKVGHLTARSHKGKEVYPSYESYPGSL